MVSPMSAERVNGIARYAKEHGWNLMIQDRLGHTPLAWNGDGIIATLRSDPVTFRCIEKLMDRGIPLVDLTVSRPEIGVPRVTSDHQEIGRLAARHFAERETGFCTPSHLTNAFKTAFRLSPKAWRLRSRR